MRSRHVSIVLAVFGLTLLLCGRAAAECIYDRAPPCQAYGDAHAVFVGTVREVTYSAPYRRGEGDWNYRRRITHFAVETGYKGVKGKLVKVVAEEIMPTTVTSADGKQVMKRFSHSDCDYHFAAGETYFVYAYLSGRNDGTLSVGLNRTRKLAEAAADTEFADELPRMGATASIFGRLVRADHNLQQGDWDRLPLAGIKVTARGDGRTFEALTDADGNYRLKDLPPGSYQVTPAYPAHLSAENNSQLARVTARGCAQLDFYTHSDARLNGRVLDAEGRPLPEVKVDLISADGPEISLRGMHVLTDGEGRYELKAVPPGRYLLGLNLSSAPGERVPYPRTYYPGVGSAAQATVINVGEGEQLPTYDLQLLPRYTDRAVEVVVTWPDGRPVGDAVLRLENSDYSSDSGATRFKGVDGREGRYQVTGFDGVVYWAHAHVNLKGGHMHAEPVKFLLQEGAGPIILVVASPGDSCLHYRLK